MAEFHYRVAILTASDKGSRGERVDESGPLIRQIIENAGYQVGDYPVSYTHLDVYKRQGLC